MQKLMHIQLFRKRLQRHPIYTRRISLDKILPVQQMPESYVLCRKMRCRMPQQKKSIEISRRQIYGLAINHNALHSSSYERL